MMQTTILHLLLSVKFPLSLPVYEFPGLYLFSVILILLKSTGQVFCRLFVNLGLSDVSSWLCWGYGFSEEEYHRSEVPFLDTM